MPCLYGSSRASGLWSHRAQGVRGKFPPGCKHTNHYPPSIPNLFYSVVFTFRYQSRTRRPRGPSAKPHTTTHRTLKTPLAFRNKPSATNNHNTPHHTPHHTHPQHRQPAIFFTTASKTHFHTFIIFSFPFPPFFSPSPSPSSPH